MWFTDFRGIKEMGIISGGGLLICLVPMMTLLPVLLLRGRQNVLDKTFPQELERRARIAKTLLGRPLPGAAVTPPPLAAALPPDPQGPPPLQPPPQPTQRPPAG